MHVESGRARDDVWRCDVDLEVLVRLIEHVSESGERRVIEQQRPESDAPGTEHPPHHETSLGNQKPTVAE